MDSVTIAMRLWIVTIQIVLETLHVPRPAFLKVIHALRTWIVAQASAGEESAGRLVHVSRVGVLRLQILVNGPSSFEFVDY